MDPMTMMLLAGGASALMGGLSAKEAQEQAKQDKLLNAQITRYQPWTGAQTQAVTKAPSTMQGVLQGGMGGAQFGLGLGNSMKGMQKGAPEFQMPSDGTSIASSTSDPYTMMLMQNQMMG